MLKKRDTLKKSLLLLSILPIFLIGIIIIAVGINSIYNALKGDVEDNLNRLGKSFELTMDKLYPGEYSLVKKKVEEDKEIIFLYKGETNISEDFAIYDELKNATGVEYSIFFGNIRYITTIVDEEGKRFINSDCPGKVNNEVLKQNKSKFYSNVKIGQSEYFTYYFPIYNKTNNVIGMFAIASPQETVSQLAFGAVMPIVLVPLAVMFIAAFFTIKYANKLTKDIRFVQKYITEVSNHNLKAELNPEIYKRNDELYDIAKATTEMKNSLKQMIEQDTLTGLHNRRYGEIQFNIQWKKAMENDKPFSIVMCDIDFFKKVNDNYGHEAGDMVLKSVAEVFKKHMAESGFAIRWGGEEFLLMFVNDDENTTYKKLEKIILEIRNMSINYCGKTIKITMTFGIAKGDVTKSVDEIIKLADNKLYYGKENGRNQIVL